MDDFAAMCFWHPVGSHAGETLAQICERKTSDVTQYGYTLWSFAPATTARVYAWRSELSKARLDACTVLCCGERTEDPYRGDGPVRWLTEYSEDLVIWQRLPHPRMSSYHRGPTKHGFVASAFYVTGIEATDAIHVDRPTTWFRAQDQSWTRGRVPTRGEYLVKKPATTEKGARVRLTLSVAYPYVVWLR